MKIKNIEVKIKKSSLAKRDKSTLTANLLHSLGVSSSEGIVTNEKGHFFNVIFNTDLIPFENIQKLVRKEPNSKTGSLILMNILILVSNPRLIRSDFHLIRKDFFKLQLNGINSKVKGCPSRRVEETITPIFKTNELKMDIIFTDEKALFLVAKAKKAFLEERNIFFKLFELDERGFCHSFLNNIINYDESISQEEAKVAAL